METNSYEIGKTYTFQIIRKEAIAFNHTLYVVSDKYGKEHEVTSINGAWSARIPCKIQSKDATGKWTLSVLERPRENASYKSVTIIKSNTIVPTASYTKSTPLKYDIGEIYFFYFQKTVDNMMSKTQYDKQFYIIRNEANETFRIPKYYWEGDSFLADDVVECRFVGYTESARPRFQRVQQPLHSHYRMGEVYDFRFLRIEEGKDSTKRIILLGEDEREYATRLLPGQIGKKFQPDIIACRLERIDNGILHLIQQDYVNPYYETIEYFVSNEEDIQKYFHSWKHDKISNPVLRELFYDYDNKQAKWVLSYCNALESHIVKNLEELVYHETVALIDILLACENWILNSGFTNTFKDTFKREKNQTKASKVVTKFTKIRKAVAILADGQAIQLVNNSLELLQKHGLDIPNYEENLLTLYYLFRFSDEKVLDNNLLIQCLKILGYEGYFDKYTQGLEHLKTKDYLKVIRFRKQLLKKSLFHNNYQINQYMNYKRSQDIKDLATLTYLEATITNKVGQNIHSLLCKSAFYRLQAYYNDNKAYQETKIKHALQLFYTYPIATSQPFFNWKNIDSKDLITLEPTNTEYNYPHTEEIWENIQNTQAKQGLVKAVIIEKNGSGYWCELPEHSGIKAFLPKLNLEDYWFRYYWNNPQAELHVIIQKYSKDFKEIILSQRLAKHLLVTPEVQEARIKELQKGQVYKGVVKSITTFGLFVDLGKVDGMIHISNLFQNNDPALNPEKIFTIGQLIPVVILEIRAGNKIELGFQQLTQHDAYKETYSQILKGSARQAETEEGYGKAEPNVAFEKALCLEHYAFITEQPWSNRLEALETAQFYYSLSYSPRSYLMGTYHKYTGDPTTTVRGRDFGTPKGRPHCPKNIIGTNPI